MLLALTRLSRSADLVKLGLQFRRYLPEGVTFQDAGVDKQSRAGRPRAEFFFPAYKCASRGQSPSELKRTPKELGYSWQW